MSNDNQEKKNVMDNWKNRAGKNNESVRNYNLNADNELEFPLN